VTWQSDRASDFRKRTEGKIAAHWGEITQHLAPPVVVWSWGESGLSQELKCYFRDKALIRRAPGEERWRTSEELWLYCIEKAGDDETIGREAQGQQLLCDASEATQTRSERPRSQTAHSTGTRSARWQATLTGERVRVSRVQAPSDPDTPELIRRIKERDPTRSDGRERAAQHPAQATLSIVELHDLDAWDTTDHWVRQSHVTEATGHVY